MLLLSSFREKKSLNVKVYFNFWTSSNDVSEIVTHILECLQITSQNIHSSLQKCPIIRFLKPAYNIISTWNFRLAL
jgi:hypothetical protein